MIRIHKIMMLFTGFCTLMSCSPSQNTSEDKWQVLFDGSDLAGWDTYLGPQFKPGITWDNIREQPALGLNNDTAGVFKVVSLDGEKVLRVSGEIWGGISTKQEFENYHLQLQFKWGELKWYPKENEKRDSGLLYHAVGQHGDEDMFWLRSQEFQIQEGDCGDYWGVAGATFDIHAKLNEDSTYQYDQSGPLLTFSQVSEVGRHCKKYPDAEKPTGEWNTIDLYCFGGASLHVVNGVKTMAPQNSGQTVNNEKMSLTKGKIQIQSEAAEVFYRNIKIRSIDQLPQIN